MCVGVRVGWGVGRRLLPALLLGWAVPLLPGWVLSWAVGLVRVLAVLHGRAAAAAAAAAGLVGSAGVALLAMPPPLRAPAGATLLSPGASGR